MPELFNNFIAWLVNYSSNQPALETVLVIIGGLVVAATVLKPLVLLIVSKTETEKDDKAAAKLYLILDSFGIAFGQLADLFKKKYPDAAKLAESVEKQGKGNG